jgi:hypothetical protein
LASNQIRSATAPRLRDSRFQAAVSTGRSTGGRHAHFPNSKRGKLAASGAVLIARRNSRQQRSAPWPSAAIMDGKLESPSKNQDESTVNRPQRRFPVARDNSGCRVMPVGPAWLRVRRNFIRIVCRHRMSWALAMSVARGSARRWCRCRRHDCRRGATCARPSICACPTARPTQAAEPWRAGPTAYFRESGHGDRRARRVPAPSRSIAAVIAGSRDRRSALKEECILRLQS